MIFDVWDELLLNYPTIQKIVFIIIIIGFLALFVIKGKFSNPYVIILLICCGFIYLYAKGIISVMVFGIVLLILSVIIYLIMKVGKNENNE